MRRRRGVDVQLPLRRKICLWSQRKTITRAFHTFLSATNILRTTCRTIAPTCSALPRRIHSAKRSRREPCQHIVNFSARSQYKIAFRWALEPATLATRYLLQLLAGFDYECVS